MGRRRQPADCGSSMIGHNEMLKGVEPLPAFIVKKRAAHFVDIRGRGAPATLDLGQSRGLVGQGVVGLVIGLQRC